MILSFKTVSLQQLGFSNKNLKKNLLIGCLLGLLPVTAVILLDGLLVTTGLAQSEYLAGAELRVPNEMGFTQSLSENALKALIIPFIDQVFVTGWVVNNLLKKEAVARTTISGGLLYSLFHLKISIGNLFLGMISAGLLRTTDSILAPLLVHIGFAIAQLTIVYHYPRLISLLVLII